MSHRPPKGHCYPLKRSDLTECFARTYEGELDVAVHSRLHSSHLDDGLWNICTVVHIESTRADRPDGAVELPRVSVSCSAIPVDMVWDGRVAVAPLLEALHTALETMASSGLFTTRWRVTLDLRVYEQVSRVRIERWSLGGRTRSTVPEKSDLNIPVVNASKGKE